MPTLKNISEIFEEIISFGWGRKKDFFFIQYTSKSTAVSRSSSSNINTCHGLEYEFTYLRAIRACPFCCNSPERDSDFCNGARSDCTRCDYRAILEVLGCGGRFDGETALPSYSAAVGNDNDVVFQFEFCSDCCLGLMTPK